MPIIPATGFKSNIVHRNIQVLVTSPRIQECSKVGNPAVLTCFSINISVVKWPKQLCGLEDLYTILQTSIFPWRLPVTETNVISQIILPWIAGVWYWSTRLNSIAIEFAILTDTVPFHFEFISEFGLQSEIYLIIAASLIRISIWVKLFFDTFVIDLFE